MTFSATTIQFCLVQWIDIVRVEDTTQCDFAIKGEINVICVAHYTSTFVAHLGDPLYTGLHGVVVVIVCPGAVKLWRWD